MQRTYASFTMRWGGIIVAALRDLPPAAADLTCVGPGGGPENSPYAAGGQRLPVWWLVLVYTIALLAVGFHLRHGVWSALTSLGANTSAVTRRRLNILAYVITIVVTVGFLLVPYAILFGVVS